MEKVRAFFEFQAFGVCSMLGKKIGIPIGSVRLFFIYASFLTMGSPVIIYLTLAFAMKTARYFRKNRSSLWDF